jgi:hypothetical protein
LSIRRYWPPKDWVRHWCPPAVTRQRRSRCLHAGYAAAAPRSRTRSTSPASRRSTMQPSTPDQRGFASVPGIPHKRCISRSATRAAGLTQTGRRPEPDGATCTTASLPSAAPWPSTRDLRTERDYTAAFRTPGRAQPQDSDPPPFAFVCRSPPIPVASRHHPGPRHKRAPRRRSNIAVTSRPPPGTAPRRAVLAVADVAPTTPINQQIRSQRMAAARTRRSEPTLLQLHRFADTRPGQVHNGATDSP